MMNSELMEARSRIADILGEAEPLGVLQRVEEHRLLWRLSTSTFSVVYFSINVVEERPLQV
jgi:hypothetical protein